MNTLTLQSRHDYPLRQFIESALENELRQLASALAQTQDRLRQFEEKYQTATAEFVTRYERDEIDETLETIEWLGEYRLAQRIEEKIEALKGIEFAN